MNVELKTILNALQGDARITVKLIEEGPGEFLHAFTHNRGIEVYRDDEGIYVECWDHSDEDPEAPSVKTDIVQTTAEAVAIALRWLHPEGTGQCDIQ